MGADANAECGGLKAAASKHIVYVKPSLGVVVKVERVLGLVSVLTAPLLMVKAANPVMVEKADKVTELVFAGWSVKNETGVKVARPDSI
jgi:hypothetical protein